MRQKVYVLSGLRIRSEIPIALPEVDGAQWDTSVTWGDDIVDTRATPPGEVVAQFSAEQPSWYTATATEDGYVVRFRDCGQFEISDDLRHVVVRRDRAGNHGLLPVLLAGTVLSFVLALRGETVLHASAVSVGGRAIGFVGVSGGGKTTTAALMCRHGADVLTDDVLTVAAGDPPICRGGANELRLRPSAASIFDGFDPIGRRTTHDGRHAITVSEPILAAQPLGALVLPVPSRDVVALEVEQLSPSSALVALLASPRVVGWTRKDVAARDFSVLGRVVDAVPVYVVTIPWGPPFDPSVAVEIELRCLGSD